MNRITFFIIYILLSCSLKVRAQGFYINGPSLGTLNTGVTPQIYPGNLINASLFNYERMYKPLVPLDSIASFNSCANQPILISTSYLDGFSDELMTVVCNGSDQDIIIPYEHRKSWKHMTFLPYPTTYHSKFQTNAFTFQKNYYSNNYGSGNNLAYSFKTIEQDDHKPTLKITTPGIKGTYSNILTATLNATNELPIVVYSSGSYCLSGYYPANTVTKKHTSVGSQETYTYVDCDGRLICKKEYLGSSSLGINGYNITYYVYNELDRLIAVIPPKAAVELHANTCITNSSPGKIFTYAHDPYANVTTRTAPDIEGEEYVIYDKKRRAALVQSAQMVVDSQLYFTIFDKLSRVVMTGIYKGPQTSSYWQDMLYGFATPATYPSIPADETLEYYLLGGFNGTYPTNLYKCKILTVNYYDSYNNGPASGISFSTAFSSDYLSGTGIQTPTPYLFAHDRLVATETYIHDNGQNHNFSDTVVKNVYFYDEKGRIIQTHTLNPWGNWDLSATQYNFNGDPVLNIDVHTPWTAVSKGQTKIQTKYVYGANTGRLDAIFQSYDGSPWQRIQATTYDELGRVKKKWLGNAEQQNYEYNVRGQLTGINKHKLHDSLTETYSYASWLGYEDAYQVGRADGKISGYRWKTRGDVATASYGYTYDFLGRLTLADYLDSSVVGSASSKTWNRSNRNYSVSNITYDDNGNILTMTQKGPTTGSSYGTIDSLSYTYNSANRLNKVVENSPNSSPIKDFDNGSSGTSNDYTFDKNGNIISDLNKSITSIAYNFVDKPLEINGSTVVKNIYAGGGRLIQKTVTVNNATDTFRYWGPYVYKNDSLLYVMTAEGRARWLPDSSFFTFDFFVRDHLGNVRTIINEKHTYEQQVTFNATFEIVAAAVEETIFEQIGEVRDLSPTLGPGDAMVGRLNACQDDHTIGSAMLVHAMPGDQLNIQGYAFYQDPNEDHYDLSAASEDVLASLIGVLTGGAVSSGEEGTTRSVSTINSLLTGTNYGTYETLKQANTNASLPRAYLNYLVFDEDLKLSSDYSRVKQVSAGTSTWELLELDGPQTMPFGGYVLVYFSNESCMDVAINNVTFTKYWGELLEKQHYYPHGLVVQQEQTMPFKNNFLFTSGYLQKEGNIELYDFPARQYDPQIGRFVSVDPLGGLLQQASLSPYHYCYNDPANFIDPTGLIGCPIIFDKGDNIFQRIGKSLSTAATDIYKAAGRLADWVDGLGGGGGRSGGSGGSSNSSSSSGASSSSTASSSASSSSSSSSASSSPVGAPPEGGLVGTGNSGGSGGVGSGGGGGGGGLGNPLPDLNVWLARFYGQEWARNARKWERAMQGSDGWTRGRSIHAVNYWNAGHTVSAIEVSVPTMTLNNLLSSSGSYTSAITGSNPVLYADAGSPKKKGASLGSALPLSGALIEILTEPLALPTVVPGVLGTVGGVVVGVFWPSNSHQPKQYWDYGLPPTTWPILLNLTFDPKALPWEPGVSPGPGWVWYPPNPPGKTTGNYYNPDSGETLVPDLDHALPKGPHWDWRDPNGKWWEIDKDGIPHPKGSKWWNK